MLRAIARRLLLPAFVIPSSTLVAQTQFFPLGYLDAFGPTSEATAVTRDGSKIVGYSTSSLTDNLACWWTAEGIAIVPGVQNWHSNSAYDISADGSVIVGDRSFGGTEEAFYWTPGNELQLVPFPTTLQASSAVDVTGDGRVLVGTATQVIQVGIDAFKVYRAFRWEIGQDAAVYLPFYLPDLQSSGAYAVSDDGRRVVGTVQTSLSTQAAALWDDGGAPVFFNGPDDPVVAITALAITPDGRTVVGTGADVATGKGVGFVWTEGGGIEALPNPTTGFHAIDSSTAVDISGDGRTIVGYGANVAGRDEAIFWVDGQPYRVSDIANAAGVLPPSWEPFRAHATDYFGNTICGYGQATSGKVEAYALILDATPDPPELVVPIVRSTIAPTTGTISIRYETIPGLRYRVRGGMSLDLLSPLNDWAAGFGAEQEFVVTKAVTGGAESFFLQLQVGAE